MSATPPLRLLTAVPICDGHDSAINTINLEFIRQGIEVIYLGYHRPARDIVRAAIQEDVRAVGLSSYNGGHVEFFAQVAAGLRERGAGDNAIGLFGGGGGTITAEDAEQMTREGDTDRIFFAGTPLDEMIGWVKATYSGPSHDKVGTSVPLVPDVAEAAPARVDNAQTRNSRTSETLVPTDDLALARRLSDAEAAFTRPVGDPLEAAGATLTKDQRCRVVGITGPGGAGKTTLIDELVLRFLKTRPDDPSARVAILSHDPSIVGKGALLGDRATMIHSQDDRVFMRSMATRGQSGGLSPATGRCLEILAGCGAFELVIIETVGTGQEAMPFGGGLVDQKVLVMNPDYGARLQLQKIAMLDVADVVVVNKSDLQGAKTASAEIERRVRSNKRGQRVLATTANRHRDKGVDELFASLIPTA